MPESKRHVLLKQIAKEKLEDMGYENVELEKQFRNYIVDVYGEKNGEIAIVECGKAIRHKMIYLSLYADHVYHLPYENMDPLRISIQKLLDSYHLLVEFYLLPIKEIHEAMQKKIAIPRAIIIKVNPDGTSKIKYEGEKSNV